MLYRWVVVCRLLVGRQSVNDHYYEMNVSAIFLLGCLTLNIILIGVILTLFSLPQA